MKQPPRLGVHEGAAAGCQNTGRLVQQARDDPALAVAEGLLAVLGKNILDRAAGGCFDLLVGIDKGQIQGRRQLASDAGLARTHKADEGDRAGNFQRRLCGRRTV